MEIAQALRCIALACCCQLSLQCGLAASVGIVLGMVGCVTSGAVLCVERRKLTVGRIHVLAYLLNKVVSGKSPQRF